MESASRVIAANQYRRERWKNGLGWTREIARSPDAGTVDWTWRLSIAEIEQDTEFSRFSGIERELVLLGGNGMDLVFDDGEHVLLESPHGKLRFSGDRALRALLSDGPTQDFNLMWNPALINAQLRVRPLVGPMLFFVEPGSTWIIHLITGQTVWNQDAGLPQLQAGDTAILTPGSASGRFVLEGGGNLIAIKLTGNPTAAA